MGQSINDFNGLTEVTDGILASRYFDPVHYQREIQRIWLRNWIYVARSSELSAARAFITFEIDTQSVLLVRDEKGELHGFFNTCRHRGAALCLDKQGTLPSGSIICPYHAWNYSLNGDLIRTSSKHPAPGFRFADFPLYKIKVREWQGFIFVALTDNPPPFDKLFDLPLNRLEAWGLQQLVVGHVLQKEVSCNWKVFWENYNECLHCPGVHPRLSRLVPIYGRGLLEPRDDPHWQDQQGGTDPNLSAGLRSGAQTWSLNGNVTGAVFANLTDEDRRLGHIYMTGLPSIFIVGHVDYVRVVRVRPLSPERMELRVEYLFAPQVLRDPAFDLQNIIAFTDQVMTEDAQICEVNQRGLRALPHRRGTLMPEEYVIGQFHAWLDEELRRD